MAGDDDAAAKQRQQKEEEAAKLSDRALKKETDVVWSRPVSH